MRHKHADLIIAWANGAQIQIQMPGHDEWTDITYPDWLPSQFYRIKPEPKPDFVHRTTIIPCGIFPGTVTFSGGPDNIELTYDGETGELKSAEVIK